MLIRVPGGRGTRDLDLTAMHPRDSDRGQVLDDIGAHTGLSDLDPFDYTIDNDQPFTGVVGGTKLRVTATIGADRVAVFGLDVAGDELPVSDVEFHSPQPVVPDVRGMSPLPVVPLYPLASQLADKIVGVMFRDKIGRSANRYRDLVDLALYAGSVDFDATQLRQAISRRAGDRGQPVPERLEVPDGWEAGYTRIASKTTLPTELHDAETAADAVGAWLDPVLGGQLPDNHVWDHRAGAWRPGDQGEFRPDHVWVRPHTRAGQPVTDYYRRRPA